MTNCTQRYSTKLKMTSYTYIKQKLISLAQHKYTLICHEPMSNTSIYKLPIHIYINTSGNIVEHLILSSLKTSIKLKLKKTNIEINC